MTGRLLAWCAAVLLVASCTNDGQRDVVGPVKGLAHIPSSSVSGATPSGATFTTDKDDYSPGETVTLSGAGWQPADVLDIHLTVDPVTHDPVDWTATVGDDGSFASSYLVQDADLGTTLTITATSKATGESATATFTDSPTPLSPVVWTGNGTTNGVCNTFMDDDKLTPGPGQQGWLFILTSPNSAFSTSNLTATFSDGAQGPIAGVQQANGSYHYIVYTTSGATLLSAQATNGMSNSQLTVSHCENAGGGPQAEKPAIDKTASGAYDNTYIWGITKDVDKTIVKQVGGSATFTYTVRVSHDAGTVSKVAVSGTITVSNPNSASITGATITDALTDGTTCSVTNGTNVTLAAGNSTFSYTCALSALPATAPDNKATVTWPAQSVGSATLAAGSQDVTKSFSFTKNDVDECVSVSDSYGGTLGTACVGDANPKSFTYSRTIAVLNGCYDYPNTATFTTNDLGVTGSASKTVTVCGPVQTGALTIGFWKTTNGQGLIKTYCQNPALANYLKGLGAGLGAGSGPFANAPTTSCNDLATYVYNILSGATATDMNKMLEAQMLGTALDVWFSGAGWTSTKIAGVKTPSNFLSHNSLGTFKMDLTAVCPMVDNTSTGTATCLNNAPSTDAVASGAAPNSPMSMQAILNFAATTTSPFNGSTSSSVWYGGDRTKEEILKNIFDQFNNQMAFGSF